MTEYEPTVYETLERSRNDPDKEPKAPPKPPKGEEWPNAMWVWIRTGPHPQGVWQAHNAGGMGWATWYAAMKREHPVSQDAAHGPPSDFGNYYCHACDYSGDGYPEPGHMTDCDGVCKRQPNCAKHPTREQELSAAESLVPKLEAALDEARNRRDELRAELGR